MKKILVVGCSITRGHGLIRESLDSKLWINQIFHDIGPVDNIAVSGMNNHWIFTETMSTLVREKNTYDIVLVAWSAIPRFCVYAGLELYSTHTRLIDECDINVNNKQTWSAAWLQRLGNDLKKLHNDHWDILDLIKYINGLIALHETSANKKILFVNTLSPWSRGYFDWKKLSLPSDLDEYTQGLLQVDSRDDDEIFKLYDMIHKEYARYGGIRESHWLNLYDSLQSMQVDDASELDCHPGYKSQDRYTAYLRPMLLEKIGTV